MPITEGKYQCKICDDIFEAKSGEYSKCKCEQSEIEPSYFGYSYKNGNKVNTIEQNSYYLEDEFVKLPDDIEEIYEDIKRIKETNGYRYDLYEMTDKGKNGERYLSQINLSYSESVNEWFGGVNEITLTLQLRKRDYEGDNNARDRLQRFLEMMKDIESGELKVSDRNRMIKMAEQEDIYYTEEPTGATNYTFYI